MNWSAENLREGAGFRDHVSPRVRSIFRFRVSGFGFRVSGFGFRVSGFGFQVSGLELRVSGSESVPGGTGLNISLGAARPG